MINKFEIKNRLGSHRTEIRNFGVKRLGLFGSAVHNALSERSDIDFIVEFTSGGKNFDNYIELAFFLETLFKMDIDLLTYDSLTETFKNRILEEVEYIEV